MAETENRPQPKNNWFKVLKGLRVFPKRKSQQPPVPSTAPKFPTEPVEAVNPPETFELAKRGEVVGEPMTKAVPEAEQPSEIVPEEMNLTGFIENRMCERTVRIPYLRAAGLEAAFITQERGEATLFHEIRDGDNPPNGYLVGVGFGAAFFSLELFPTAPKGIVLADMDPRVVIFGRAAIEAVKRHATRKEFVQNFLDYHLEEMSELMREVREQLFANDSRVNKYEINDTNLHLIAEEVRRGSNTLSMLFDEDEFIREEAQRSLREFPKNEAQLDHIGFMFARHYDKLRQLALDGKFTIVHGDMVNLNFLQILSELPGFTGARNVIYLSNIADHVTGRGRDLRGVNKMNQVQLLFNSEPDSLQVQSFEKHIYMLEISRGFRSFTEADFDPANQTRGSTSASQEYGENI